MKRGILVVSALCASAAFAGPASASVGAPPATCADIAAANPSATDGNYTIYPNGETISVYCADMSSAPKEYLTLQNTTNANFSTDVDSQGSSVMTSYTKVRLDPATLQVDIGDPRFSSTSGYVNYNNHYGPEEYAVAADCIWYGSTRGTANVDLTGTPFSVNDTFAPQGWGQAGSSVFSDNNQVVNLTGGGYCGDNEPSNHSYLQLAYNGTTYAASPSITPTVAGTTGNNGWYTSPVKITWASDQPIVASEGCGETDVTTDTAGSTYTCTFSGPGGVSSKSVAIKLDSTPPAIALTGGGTYSVADTVKIGCDATDVTSGVASSDCASVAGSEPAYNYALGDTTITTHATDQAGNSSSATETVTVIATPSALKALVGQFSSDPGVTGGLGAKLDAIGNAPNANAKAGSTRAFINQVNAQTGKALTANQAATLIRLVQTL
jgi:hypothetical protein